MPKPKKIRIVERTLLNGSVIYVLQEEVYILWVFGPYWRDIWQNDTQHQSFDTLEEAKARICYLDGSEPSERIVFPLEDGKSEQEFGWKNKRLT